MCYDSLHDVSLTRDRQKALIHDGLPRTISLQPFMTSYRTKHSTVCHSYTMPGHVFPLAAPFTAGSQATIYLPLHHSASLATGYKHFYWGHRPAHHRPTDGYFFSSSPVTSTIVLLLLSLCHFQCHFPLYITSITAFGHLFYASLGVALPEAPVLVHATLQELIILQEAAGAAHTAAGA